MANQEPNGFGGSGSDGSGGFGGGGRGVMTIYE
jgi:hypothetical protein